MRKEHFIFGIMLLFLSFVFFGLNTALNVPKALHDFGDFMWFWEKGLEYALFSLLLLPLLILRAVTQGAGLGESLFFGTALLCMYAVPLFASAAYFRFSRKDVPGMMLSVFVCFLIPKILQVLMGSAPISQAYAGSSGHPELRTSSLFDWALEMIVFSVIYGIVFRLWFSVMDLLSNKNNPKDIKKY